jgi:hypothetical protein
MGLEPSIQLSLDEVHKMRLLLASASPGSRQASNIRIIMEVASGKKKRRMSQNILE